MDFFFVVKKRSTSSKLPSSVVLLYMYGQIWDSLLRDVVRLVLDQTHCSKAGAGSFSWSLEFCCNGGSGEELDRFCASISKYYIFPCYFCYYISSPSF
jgi:hypothetical protein